MGQRASQDVRSPSPIKAPDEGFYLTSLKRRERKAVLWGWMLPSILPIYACPRANQTLYSSVHVTFCGSWMYSLLN